MQDSIPIHRDTLKHWVYCDSDYFKVWVTMLSKARYLTEPKKGMYHNINYTLQRGEFLFGRKKWNEDTGVSEQKLRTLVKKLLKEEMIVNIAVTPKFTIYLIKNYEKFNQLQTQEVQGVEGDSQPSDNQQPTSNQPATNQHLTTNKESSNKAKKAKQVNKNTYGECVKLSDGEVEKLKAEFGQVGLTKMITILDNYKGSSGKKYVSDYKAILSWVVKRYQDEQGQTKLFGNKKPFSNNTAADAIDNFFGGAHGTNNRSTTNGSTEESNDIETFDVSFSECED